MDPPLIGESSFSTANPSLSEIWPFTNNNNNSNTSGAEMAGLLGLRMGSGGAFGSGLIDALLNNGGQTLVNRDGSIEESSVTEQSGSFGGAANKKRRENFDEDESSKLVSTTTSANDLKDSNSKRVKASSSKDENGNSKAGGESSSADGDKPPEKPAEPPKDYIHVRARRGQATDSHSLAERARREKISERMKILQDLVPGCNKVIGKAVVLDEIINYIQSLQRQVEFLSMKLEAVNSGMIPSINGFNPKDVNQLGVPAFDASGMMYGAQAAREFAGAVPQPEWLHMQLGGSFERPT